MSMPVDRHNHKTLTELCHDLSCQSLNACIDKHDHKTFEELCHDLSCQYWPVDRHNHKTFEELRHEHCVKCQLTRGKLKALGN